MLPLFECFCRYFILPEICKPCLFFFLRNLLYLIFYFPVVLSADAIPMIGTLMIPKIYAYVWTVLIEVKRSVSTVTV